MTTTPPDRGVTLGELRARMVDKVLENGGHLGSNLGVVELTVALHRVFSVPDDVLVWDVGHQAYVHKMLTGRAEGLSSLRQAGGMSGYPCPGEHAGDISANSHASVGLSYGAGLALAARLDGVPRHVVVVVGDGALTGGVAFEALNAIGGQQLDVLVVVNDNGRSYDPTVGGLSDHLTGLRHGKVDVSVFELLGFSFLGTVDGHDVETVEEALRRGREQSGPRVLHVTTQKGKGFDPAEGDEVDHLHAVGPRRRTDRAEPARASWTDHFAQSMVRLAAARDDVVAVTAAMRLPTGLGPMSERFPDRVIDVGIAEQYALGSAAGLARGGKRPVVAIYSTFLNRAFDQLLMDIGLHRLPVVIVADRAGVTGPDGASHHGLVDLAIARAVPGLRVQAPRSPEELDCLLRAALDHDGPTFIRFPKGTPPARDIVTTPAACEAGEVLIVALGSCEALARGVVEELGRRGIAARLASTSAVQPLEPAIVEMASRSSVTVTVEDHWARGGFGTALMEELARLGRAARVVPVALPHAFLPHGPAERVRELVGMEACAIATELVGRGVFGRPEAGDD